MFNMGYRQLLTACLLFSLLFAVCTVALYASEKADAEAGVDEIATDLATWKIVLDERKIGGGGIK
ncbi:MAG: hypothetical protein HRU15_19975, partial [Planctomycetes bacterium]|nr:hypothetical protein [Planctomycetota bacterium]